MPLVEAFATDLIDALGFEIDPDALPPPPEEILSRTLEVMKSGSSEGDFWDFLSWLAPATGEDDTCEEEMGFHLDAISKVLDAHGIEAVY